MQENVVVFKCPRCGGADYERLMLFSYPPQIEFRCRTFGCNWRGKAADCFVPVEMEG